MLASPTGPTFGSPIDLSSGQWNRAPVDGSRRTRGFSFRPPMVLDAIACQILIQHFMLASAIHIREASIWYVGAAIHLRLPCRPQRCRGYPGYGVLSTPTCGAHREYFSRRGGARWTCRVTRRWASHISIGGF